LPDILSLLQTSCCGPDAIEWEDLVSVRLHQLPFNETERGVQLQPGRRTDIEVLIRPG
ncbi:G polyprotein, partial [Dissostichus eleginoides]